MNENTRKILRWIAVPFSATIGAAIIYVLSIILFYFQGWFVGYNPNDNTLSLTPIILTVLKDFVAGGAPVFCGSITAPNHNVIVGFVIAGVVCILVGFSLAHYIMTGGMWLHYIGLAASAIGAFATAFYVLKNNQ